MINGFQLPICLVILVLSGAGIFPIGAQTAVPGTIQDADEERRQLLKAADQIEILVQRTETLQKELDKTKVRVAELEKANQNIKQEMKTAQAAHRKERDALLDEVSKLLAETGDPAPPPSGVTASSDEGYEHVVKKGQSLWTIAKAFQAQGVSVTVEDIRKANQLEQDALLQVGQKLFIPKTD